MGERLRLLGLSGQVPELRPGKAYVRPGKAYVAVGDRAEAIINDRRSPELGPKNRNAAAMPK